MLMLLLISRKGDPLEVPVQRRPPPSPTSTAAQTIQRYWRQRFSKNTTAKILHHAFTEIGVSREHMRSISFDDLVLLLREKPVVAAMKAALQRIHSLATHRHGSPSKSLSPENVDVRVFLAAYMIAYRSTHVFESMGMLEQALLESAVPMINQFHAICDALVATPGRCFQAVPSALTEEFPTALFEYLKRFKAWKVPDEAKLTCRIKHALIALYQAEGHLPPDEPEDSKLKVEFRTQIDRLRGKLLQIAGQAALDKLDADRLVGAPDTTTTSSGGAYAALPGRMTNEQLTHELLLDPTFQLDDTGGCNIGDAVFRRMRESFHQAFWDSLVDDLRLETPCYVRVIRVLGEIRDGIVDLAGEGESIDEVVDVDFIRTRAEAGNYGFSDAARLFGDVVRIILRVQAPTRDAETRGEWSALENKIAAVTLDSAARVTCDGLEFLLERVNAMRIDAANSRLRLIAPVIREHGLDYARGKFADKIRDGTLTTDRTIAWLHRAMASAPADITERFADGLPSAALEMHALAIVSLVGSNAAPVTAETAPETLLFDVHRLVSMQQQFESLLSIQAAFLVVASTKDQPLIDRVAATIRTMEPGAPLDVGILGLPAGVAAHVATVVVPTSGVSKAVRKNFCALLRRSIVNTAPVACAELVAKFVEDVRRVAILNRAIHTDTYNEIMRRFQAAA